MKEVLLLRHAKSSWDSDTTRDFDRPLNGRGRRAAPLIGAYLAAHDLIPERIYCSAAARTRETLALMVDGWPQAPATRFDEGLYLASPDHMRATIRAADPEADRIMLIAHNPGLETLALHLADPDASDRIALREPSRSSVISPKTIVTSSDAAPCGSLTRRRSIEHPKPKPRSRKT